MEGFASLQTQCREVMERHHPEVARWDSDMTAEAGPEAATADRASASVSSSASDGVLPTLRLAEGTLLRAEAKCAGVDRLLQLQERYRQDSSGLQARVRALYEAVAEEDASDTDLLRQRFHEHSQAVFAGVKRLKERVRKAQAAYRAAGISLAAASGGSSSSSSGSAAEEGLSDLRAQVRRLGDRLHRIRYHVEEEGQVQERIEEELRRARGGGGGAPGGHDEDEDEDDEGAPPITGAAAT